jgi:hypothetical protein
MSEFPEFSELMRNGALRRLWFLYRAISDVPLDGAIELARAAEVFVTGAAPDPLTEDPPRDAIGKEPDRQAIEERQAELPNAPVATEDSTAIRGSVLNLTEEQRDRLLTRLAAGAKNAELAAEFGLSPKQIQGIRMGSAREIARRRGQPSNAELQESVPGAIIDDIIRYLRQQDDVVVSQEDGSYLINGRFRMTTSELIMRANRMRTRQRKPAFEFGNGALSDPQSASGHPLFWPEQEKS